MLVIPFPHINPYIVRFGELGITWYSLSYVVGIIFAWKYAVYIARIIRSKITEPQLDEVVTYIIIGIIFGGRFGHVLFYEPLRYLANPIEIFLTYKGGMSFHGGLIGVILASLYFCRKHKINFLHFTDIIALSSPVGLMLGRIANFINGELYGEFTDLPWGVIFPHAGDFPRHPSQLYEALLEGGCLFIVLNYLALRKLYISFTGLITGYFLLFYGIARYICEFFRIPDFEIFGISAGQFYSIPMMVCGAYIIFTRYGNKKYNS